MAVTSVERWVVWMADWLVEKTDASMVASMAGLTVDEKVDLTAGLMEGKRECR